MIDELSKIDIFIDKSNNQIKWTISISIFLVTSIFTLLTFKKDVSVISVILLLFTLIPFLVNIYTGWIIIHESFLINRAIFDARSFPNNEKLKNDIYKRLECSSHKIETKSKYHHLSFISGFIIYVVFIFSFFIIERLL